MSSATDVRVADLTAGYGDAVGGGGRRRRHPAASRPVLAGLDFELASGDCLAVVGRSGCGKSTLLHVLAGLLEPQAGTVWSGGRVVAAGDWAGTGAPGCSAGHAAYMFQRDLLLPWKTALQNAVFPAQLAARRERTRRAAPCAGGELVPRAVSLLTEFGLEDALEAVPAELSGGMRQRVALARTILLERGLILLDEPLGSLDAVTRTEMRRWLLEVMAAHPATWVLVTHDVEEAVLLGDHVAVLQGDPGRLEGWRDAPLHRAARTRAAAAAAGCGEAAGADALALARAAEDVRRSLGPVGQGAGRGQGM